MKRFTLTVFLVSAVGVLVILSLPGNLSAQRGRYPQPHTRDGKSFSPSEFREQNGGNPTYSAHPATQDPSVLVTPEILRRWETELSNWGRWGESDTRGLLNLITPEKAKQAVGSVTEGVTVSLQHFVEWEPTFDGWRFWPSEHWMTSVDPETGEVRGALDGVRFSSHDGTLSHLDGICHYERQAPMLNIDPDYRVTFNGHRHPRSEDSCQGAVGITGMGFGYVTRGILVDMPLLKGVPWLEPTTPIFVSDLEAWEKFAGVTVGPGDVLLVRGGRWAKSEAEGAWAYDRGGAGLHASVLPWLHARDVSLLVGDAVNDVQPSGVEGSNRPVHTWSMVVMGLPTVDNGYLEDVAREAQRLKRWEFMISWQINQAVGATASPFNAIATF